MRVALTKILQVLLASTFLFTLWFVLKTLENLNMEVATIDAISCQLQKENEVLKTHLKDVHLNLDKSKQRRNELDLRIDKVDKHVTEEVEKQKHLGSSINNVETKLTHLMHEQKDLVKTIKHLHAGASTSLCSDEEKGSTKVISYSLFGKNAVTYGRFIKDVAQEAQSIDLYKDFTLRIYVDENFPARLRTEYKKNHTNIRFCDVNKISQYRNLPNTMGRAWRFVTMADETVDVACSRDLDSPLLQRESGAVKEWMESGKIFHVMRDRPTHYSRIMAGTWCFKNKKNRTMGKDLFNIFMKKSSGLSLNSKRDQYVLNNHVWPKVENDSVQHDAYLCDSFKGSQPFPTKREDFFVGCVRDCWVFGKVECPSKCRPRKHKDWKYC